MLQDKLAHEEQVCLVFLVNRSLLFRVTLFVSFETQRDNHRHSPIRCSVLFTIHNTLIVSESLDRNDIIEEIVQHS